MTHQRPAQERIASEIVSPGESFEAMIAVHVLITITVTTIMTSLMRFLVNLAIHHAVKPTVTWAERNVERPVPAVRRRARPILSPAT